MERSQKEKIPERRSKMHWLPPGDIILPSSVDIDLIGESECSASVNRHHTIIRAAFVCLFVCSPTPPRSFDGSSPNLVGVCRWISELPLRSSLLKRSTGQRVKCHFFGADDTRLRPHRNKKHTASFAQQKAHSV